MGTGDIALPSFSSLIESDYEIIGLFTQPDKPVGRKQILTAPAIKKLALGHDIPVWQPDRLRGSQELEIIEELNADLIVVMAYGQILPKRVIDAPRIACVNLHASLLPRHRGASCIQAAIDANDEQTGISLMHVAPALDEGDVILQHGIDLLPHHTGGEIHDTLAELAPITLMTGLQDLVNGSAVRTIQDDAQATYAPKLLRNDGEIDWTKSALEIERRIRSYDPWPGTSTSFNEAKGKNQGIQRRLKIFPKTEILSDFQGKPGEVLQYDQNGLIVACGQDAIRISQLQPEGSGKMSTEQFAQGGRIEKGSILGA